MLIVNIFLRLEAAEFGTPMVLSITVELPFALFRSIYEIPARTIGPILFCNLRGPGIA